MLKETIQKFINDEFKIKISFQTENEIRFRYKDNMYRGLNYIISYENGKYCLFVDNEYEGIENIYNSNNINDVIIASIFSDKLYNINNTDCIEDEILFGKSEEGKISIFPDDILKERYNVSIFLKGKRMEYITGFEVSKEKAINVAKEKQKELKEINKFFDSFVLKGLITEKSRSEVIKMNLFGYYLTETHEYH